MTTGWSAWAYHVGAGDERPAYGDAPLGLDENGAFVFNPGLGLEIDFFRSNSHDPLWLGFSPIIKVVHSQGL